MGIRCARCTRCAPWLCCVRDAVYNDRLCALVAQWIEHRSPKAGVVGSNPIWGTIAAVVAFAAAAVLLSAAVSSVVRRRTAWHRTSLSRRQRPLSPPTAASHDATMAFAAAAVLLSAAVSSVVRRRTAWHRTSLSRRQRPLSPPTAASHDATTAPASTVHTNRGIARRYQQHQHGTHETGWWGARAQR